MKHGFLRYGIPLAACVGLICVVAAHDGSVSAETAAPRIQFSGENVGPRSIEDLTSKSVPRDYRLAWQTMEEALRENQIHALDGYFTGSAKQDLTERVNSQLKSGLTTRIEDHGHQVEAIFYSPAGDAMQLRDHARLEMQVLDGGKVIYEEPVTAEYYVIMSPGADRWLVRQMQTVSGEKP
jgi:hypothetical protein